MENTYCEFHAFSAPSSLRGKKTRCKEQSRLKNAQIAPNHKYFYLCRMGKKGKSEKLQPVMLAGTGSDVGKSTLATGLCRIFLQDGYTPAPFKAQNMSLNSYVTADGLELGRAQAVQAEAAGLPCLADMNPILLKPTGDSQSQVILLGRVAGNSSAYDYYRRNGYEKLHEVATHAYDRLAAQYSPIVLEGAGSVSELNLREHDVVNLPMARHANAKVLLVGDIERGGIFASLYGSLALMQPWERKLIGGVIVNKFRGDQRLFKQGRAILEEICEVPVLGVVPYMSSLSIEAEDSVSLNAKPSLPTRGKVNICVVKLAHLSNFTDLLPLEHDDRLHVYYTDAPTALAEADIIIIPGSKNTRADLKTLRNKGLDAAITDARQRGKTIIGICGGYQIMGHSVADPLGLEGDPGTEQGLGLLPVDTVLHAEKQTRRESFRIWNSKEWCYGYEIHMGVTTPTGGVPPSPLCTTQKGTPDGYLADLNCWGTYMHGILENAAAVNFLLRGFLPPREHALDFRQFKEKQYNQLADNLREHLDMKTIYRLLTPCE